MQIHTSIAALRAALAPARNDKRIALVPTMGNLHDGHIALMRAAREHGDIVVASVFVNRIQFRPGEDFEAYPRTLDADSARLREAGVDHLFAPDEAAMYPEAQNYFVEPPVEQQGVLDGEFRPGHFRGVATVVAKLFNIVQPRTALFGKKDYQQVMVIRNMVRQLALPVTVIAGETVRAVDGLALSSRNAYLTSEERAEAPRLHRVITELTHAVKAGNKNFQQLEKDAVKTLISAGWRPDYVAVRRRNDLQLPTVGEEALVVLAAAVLGKTRLIDNLEI